MVGGNGIDSFQFVLFRRAIPRFITLKDLLFCDRISLVIYLIAAV